MSTPKTLVLTRPDASSARLLSQVEAAFGTSVSNIISPVLRIEQDGSWPRVSPFDAIIVTSTHAIWGPLEGKPVFCVGERTAQAARHAGGDVKLCTLDVERLVHWIKTQNDLGSLLYLRGSHITMDIVSALSESGIPCTEQQVYRQQKVALSDAARVLIEGESDVILPLFSPRSARLVGGSIAKPGGGLHVISISDAVAKEWRQLTGGSCEVLDKPSGDAMVSRIVAALQP